MREIEQESRNTQTKGSSIRNGQLYFHVYLFKYYRKVAAKIRMQIVASLYAFKLVKTLLLTFFMHFHDNL